MLCCSAPVPVIYVSLTLQPGWALAHPTPQISSAHDNEVRKLTDEVAHSNSRLETMKLHDGCQEASLLLRDRIAWSLKRGFDKWSNFALAKEKENDLRRTKMKIQVCP